MRSCSSFSSRCEMCGWSEAMMLASSSRITAWACVAASSTAGSASGRLIFHISASLLQPCGQRFRQACDLLDEPAFALDLTHQLAFVLGVVQQLVSVADRGPDRMIEHPGGVTRVERLEQRNHHPVENEERTCGV